MSAYPISDMAERNYRSIHGHNIGCRKRLGEAGETCWRKSSYLSKEPAITHIRIRSSGSATVSMRMGVARNVGQDLRTDHAKHKNLQPLWQRFTILTVCAKQGCTECTAQVISCTMFSRNQSRLWYMEQNTEQVGHKSNAINAFNSG